MQHLELSRWLKITVIVISMFGLAFCFWIIPAFGSSLAKAYPEFAHLFWPCLIGIWIASSCVFVVLFCVWKICSEIGNDRSFSEKNARYLRVISKLALFDSVFCLAGPIILFLLNAMPCLVFLVILLIVVVGFSVSVAAAIISRLVLKAAVLKEDQDLTI